ncbi:unnamed protein product, partial [Penicillium discolor]
RRDVLLVPLVPGDLEPPDEQRQREALQQERAHRDDEGDDDDGVRGLGVEPGQIGGGHCDRQGHHATHTRPGDDGIVLPREHEALQQQVGREPQRRLLLPGRVVGARGVEADEQPHGHDREDAGAEQVLRDVVRAERGEQTE